jgi:hypothetical protein
MNTQKEKMDILLELQEIVCLAASLNSSSSAMTTAIDLSEKAKRFLSPDLRSGKASPMGQIISIIHGEK